MLSALLFFLGLLGASVAAAAVNLYVAPSGNDTTGTGTETLPWRTLAKARDYIRAQGLNVGMTQDVIVNLAHGDYPLTQTLAFTDADSGSNGYFVIYRSQDGNGAARVHGGLELTGWTLDSGLVYWASAQGKTFHTLFENGVRGRSARHPNWVIDSAHPVAQGPYLNTEAGTTSYIQYKSGDLNPTAWTLTGESKVAWWAPSGNRDWGVTVNPISSINTTTRQIALSGVSSSFPPGVNDRYFVSGVRALLDSPGEYFLDTANDRVYYQSPFAGGPEGHTVVVPVLSTLISVIGTSTSQPASYLRFEGLDLAYTDDDDADGPGSALKLQNTHHIELINSRLERLGRFGVRMIDYCHDNKIYGCFFYDIGWVAVMAQNTLTRAAAPTLKSEHHLISNCLIMNTTTTRPSSTSAGGVVLYNVSDSEVSYCEIYNSARYALSLRGSYSTQWTPSGDNGTHYAIGNVFKYCRVENCGQDSGDMGAVHAAHVNATGGPNINYWKQIIINQVGAISSMLDFAPNGIFLDHPSSCQNQDFENIQITNTQGTAFRTNGNPNQTTSNVSWVAGFNAALMDTANIGLKGDFPTELIPPTREIIVDNANTSAYTETGTGWSTSTVGGAYAGTARLNTTNSVSNYATWRPTIPATGTYSVAVWKFGSTGSSTTAAKYTVNYNGGSLLYTVNQQTPSNQWQVLGSHPFVSGTTGTTVLTANGGSGAQVRADAVKWTWVPTSAAPAAYWTLDNTANDSAGTNHGTLSGGPTYSTDRVVGTHSLSFDGSDDYVDMGDTADLDMGTSDFAISGWIKRATNGGTNLRVLSKGCGSDSDTGYAIWGSDTLINAAFCDGTTRTYVSGTHGGVGQWTHIAVNFDRDGYMELFIDGASASRASISAASAVNLSNARNFNLGRNSTGAAQYWPGLLDNFRVYRRLLTPEEIAAQAVP